MKTYVLILASGTGSRTGLDVPKQFYKIHGKTVLEYTTERFENHPLIDEIMIVSHPDYIEQVKNLIKSYKKVTKVTEGGKTRQLSAYNGLMCIGEENGKVLIHDAARPFVSNKIISDCIEALDKFKAVNVVAEVSDTLVKIDKNNIITEVPDRREFGRCQTPQGFDLNTIKKAQELAAKEGYISATDDCSLILKYKLADIYAIPGSNDNIKITYPEDIKKAEIIFKY